MADEYTKLTESLTTHFTPKRNIAYEVLKFRAAKQLNSESLDSFHTRLRTLAAYCEFHDMDNEILTQILQGCTSNHLRRRALREGYSLQQILSAARAQELSELKLVHRRSNLFMLLVVQMLCDTRDLALVDDKVATAVVMAVRPRSSPQHPTTEDATQDEVVEEDTSATSQQHSAGTVADSFHMTLLDVQRLERLVTPARRSVTTLECVDQSQR